MNGDLARARDLLRRAPVLDGHNDLAWQLRNQVGYDLDRIDLRERVAGTHTDLPRLAAGGVGAQFWSVYVPVTLAGDSAVSATLEQIEFVHRMVARHGGALQLATTADDVRQAEAGGRIASLLGAEGGHSINCSMGALRALYLLGVRYMTLTHNTNVPWADAATDEPAAGGLTAFGREVVREMQRLGMLVDCSHVSPDTMRDALDIAEGPIVFSHSSARALCDHPRNVPDALLERLPANGGVCMVTFVPAFVSPACAQWRRELADEMRAAGLQDDGGAAAVEAEARWTQEHPSPQATLRQVADHVDHVRAVAGVDHVGLGGDFDGTSRVPVGLEDVSCYPALIAELLGRGWSEADCAKLAGGNALRVLRDAEATARDLSSRRGPSLARIEDLDPATAATGPRPRAEP